MNEAHKTVAVPMPCAHRDRPDLRRAESAGCLGALAAFLPFILLLWFFPPAQGPSAVVGLVLFRPNEVEEQNHCPGISATPNLG